MIQASHKWGTLLLALLLMLQCGCARTVSTVSDTFFIELKLTLNGTVDSSNYNYYILFSTDADTAIEPQMIETLDEYFPSPAQNYSTLGVNLNANAVEILSYYYSTYFSTWSDYIFIQGNQANLVESGDTSFAADTSDNDTYINTLTFKSSLLIDSTSITLVFEVDQLGLVENDTLLFSLLTAARTTEYSSTDQFVSFEIPLLNKVVF